MPTKIIADGFAFIEGPRWHDEKLWFSDMHSEQVFSLVPGEAAKAVCSVPNRPSGLGWLPDGTLLVVSMMDQAVYRLGAGGALSKHADLSHIATRRTNDMVVDGRGYAYVGNFGFDFDDGEAPTPTALALVRPDGTAAKVADGLIFPNGMAITPDGKTLIVAETFAAQLTAFTIGEDGMLSNRRLFASLSDGAVPDGICLDAEGAVWVASPTSGACLRMVEGGHILARIDTGRQAIACALGGADGQTLFIATSSSTHRETCLEARDARIEQVQVDVPGAGWP